MMFDIRFCENRNIEDGQYFVEISDLRDCTNPMLGHNRLGYFCDKGHLDHLLYSVMIFYTGDEIINKLSKLKRWSDKDNGN